MILKQLKERYRFFSLFGVILLSIGFGVFQFSCYPGDPIDSSTTDVVVTFYDPDANFSGKLYAMPDTVVHLAASGQAQDNISRQYDQQILNRIGQNLQDLGYTEVADPAQANVYVVTLATTNEWVSGGCYWSWDYWYGYPGYCYPVAYSYTTGSLVISMVDADNTSKTDALWIAGINGLLSESNAVDISGRINKNIDQAFDQSPYLK